MARHFLNMRSCCLCLMCLSSPILIHIYICFSSFTNLPTSSPQKKTTKKPNIQTKKQQKNPQTQTTIVLRARNRVPCLQKSGKIMLLVDGTEVFITAFLLNLKRAIVPLAPESSISAPMQTFSQLHWQAIMCKRPDSSAKLGLTECKQQHCSGVWDGRAETCTWQVAEMGVQSQQQGTWVEQ